MGGGRKCEFCKDQALDAAMRVFWQKGYLGASLSELTSAMGINKPSLYAAFGNKEQLFVAAAQHYINAYAVAPAQALEVENDSVSRKLANYLTAIAELQTNPDLPCGCFISIAASEAAGDGLPELAQKVVEEACTHSENLLTDFFQKQIDRGVLAADRSAELYSRYTLTFIHGMGSMARNGSSLADIQDVIDLAIKLYD